MQNNPNRRGKPRNQQNRQGVGANTRVNKRSGELWFFFPRQTFLFFLTADAGFGGSTLSSRELLPISFSKQLLACLYAVCSVKVLAARNSTCSPTAAERPPSSARFGSTLTPDTTHAAPSAPRTELPERCPPRTAADAARAPVSVLRASASACNNARCPEGCAFANVMRWCIIASTIVPSEHDPHHTAPAQFAMHHAPTTNGKENVTRADGSNKSAGSENIKPVSMTTTRVFFFSTKIDAVDASRAFARVRSATE